ncbi:hypothetical protein ONS95_014336 [Cadophora gregata]|uniref:uncharacterized protein n=1 Tax=Cadophora gregata TaxID=51156 RepID=UPI0026DBC315|nr:uncharacterized protein ONS95_014336 [Cadophora gregata]KAK0112592.1 hypothetical protein ONS95_014336 [Cadophora gregata]
MMAEIREEVIAQAARQRTFFEEQTRINPEEDPKLYTQDQGLLQVQSSQQYPSSELKDGLSTQLQQLSLRSAEPSPHLWHTPQPMAQFSAKTHLLDVVEHKDQVVEHPRYSVKTHPRLDVADHLGQSGVQDKVQDVENTSDLYEADSREHAAKSIPAGMPECRFVCSSELGWTNLPDMSNQIPAQLQLQILGPRHNYSYRPPNYFSSVSHLPVEDQVWDNIPDLPGPRRASPNVPAQSGNISAHNPSDIVPEAISASADSDEEAGGVLIQN